ncbi:MAG: magnesium transporter CorA family protein [Gaiellales bacterium]
MNAKQLTIFTSIDRDRIGECRARGEFFWLDLTSPSEEQIVELGEFFGLHELAVEDTRKFDQRPKIEPYGEYAFMVFFGVHLLDGEPTPLEVHAFVHGDYMITVHREDCVELDGLRVRLQRSAAGVEMLVIYRVLDALTDSFFPLLASLDDEIDTLADDIVAKENKEHLQRIFELKRMLVQLRRVVSPQRDMMARAADQLLGLPGLEVDAHDYFRDVYDHMIRISEMIDTNRELLTGTVDLYLSTAANRQNEEMKQLTVMASIFLPLAFIVGFFGQNFRWMVDHIDSRTDFLIYGIGSLVVSTVVLMAYFKRRRYW